MATYISTFERKAHAEGVEEGVEIGRQEGLLAGLEFGLRLRFGEAGLALMPALKQIPDPDVLEKLLGVLAGCESLADFERAIPQV